MCLTIPKKVISIKNDTIVVETPGKDRQEVKSIVKLRTNDYVLTQQNVAIQKIGKKQAEELLGLLKEK